MRTKPDRHFNFDIEKIKDHLRSIKDFYKRKTELARFIELAFRFDKQRECLSDPGLNNLDHFITYLTVNQYDFDKIFFADLLQRNNVSANTNNTYSELLKRLKDLGKCEDAKKILSIIWKKHYLDIAGRNKEEKYFTLKKNSEYSKSLIKKYLLEN